MTCWSTGSASSCGSSSVPRRREPQRRWFSLRWRPLTGSTCIINYAANMANNESLGRVLRAARQLRSLRSVAQAAEISPAYLSDIENDRRIPADVVIDRLAKALDMQADLLCAWTGRVGEKAERYLRREPAAMLLVRKIADHNLSDIELTHLSATVDEMRPTTKRKAKR